MSRLSAMKTSPRLDLPTANGQDIHEVLVAFGEFKIGDLVIANACTGEVERVHASARNKRRAGGQT